MWAVCDVAVLFRRAFVLQLFCRLELQIELNFDHFLESACVGAVEPARVAFAKQNDCTIMEPGAATTFDRSLLGTLLALRSFFP